MSWTDERVERLKTLWLDGLSASQIAAELGGVTRNAVIGKVHRLGLSGRQKPQVQSSRPSSPPRPKNPAPPRPASPSVRPARPMTIGNTALKADVSVEIRTQSMPVVEEGPIVFERVTILNLTENTCKWPVGDPGRPDFFFCGRKSDSGIPYCAHHARIAYQPSSERRRDRRAGG
jgi:GcrA cell cycle regulator